MSAAEFLDWQVLEELDSWGQRRDDYRFCYGLSVIVNALGRRKVDGEIFRPSDFMGDLLFNPHRVAAAVPAVTSKPQTADDITKIIDLWVRGSNIAMQEQLRSNRGRH